jgi:phosphoribosylformimino-5-aminoimidazole carboxamide ribonucleotide (ProFAR) isomerase
MICVSIAKNGTLTQDAVNVPPNCTYELMTPAEISGAVLSINDLTALYQQYFGFDPDLFAIVCVSCLTTFATGFCIGAMWKAWGKVM